MDAPSHPETLYKYCPPERLEALEDHTLRITPFRELNDPFECMPLLESSNVENSWHDALFRYFKEEGGKGNQLGRQFRAYLKRHAGSKQRWMEAFLPQGDSVMKLADSYGFQQSYGRSFGVVCLSSRPDSALMWSHYSKQHEGYVLGIRPAPFLKYQKEGTGRFATVDYLNERVVFQRESVVHAQLEPRSVGHYLTVSRLTEILFFRKSLDWSYEDEWRLAAVYEIGHRSAQNDQIVTLDYGSENLSEIIVGFRAKPELVARIEAVKERLPGVRLRYAAPSVRTFDMEIHDSIPAALAGAPLRPRI